MRAARVDANQPQIVKALRDRGCTVICLHTVGKGCPDIMVGYNGINILMEIKDGDKPPSQQNLTPPQQKFFNEWLGSAFIVNSIESALSIIDHI